MLNSIISNLSFLLIRLLSMTYRYEFRNKTIKECIDSSSQNYVYAVWHNNIIGTILSHTKESHIVIVSASKDGDIIAKILTKLGNTVARGSSSRGGVRALAEMINLMKKTKQPGAISIDGPRGPIHKAKKGIVEVAKETGAVILPLSSYPTSSWVFENAWDKFRLPKPFSKIILQYSEPITVPENFSSENFDQILRNIETSLHQGEKEIIETL